MTDTTIKNAAGSPLLRCAVDTMEGIFLAFTEEGKILHYNSQLKEVTGYSDDEIKEMAPTDLTGEEAGQIEERLEGGSEEGRVQFESYLKTKEGRSQPYAFTASLLRLNGGKLICLGGRATGGEQPGRHSQEDRPGEREERYRRLFEEAKEGIAMITPEGEIEEVNPAAAKIFGYSREELQVMNVTSLFIDSGEWKSITEDLYQEGVLVGREVRLRRTDGEEIVCQISSTLLRTEEGTPTGCQTFFRDVTDRKKAEEALRESEETFRKLAEGALVGITLIQEGIFKYVNPALSRITGYPQEELIGESPEVSTHPEDWPYVEKQINRRIEGEDEEVHYETRVLTKSGETRHIEVSGSRITFRGKPAVIATAQDVTEQRRLRREILRVQEEERKRLGQDLHDSVASQLTGANLMLSSLSAIVQEEKAKEGIEEVQGMIKESAGDVRRLSRGLNPGGLSEGDLNSALEGLAQNTEGARLEAEDEIASTLEGETATHLYRIAQEATSNARRHGEAEEIVIRLKREDGVLILEIEDDGKGFDPSSVGKEGLGLRSMHHRADFLGAKLKVDSSPREGTIVRLRLPI